MPKVAKRSEKWALKIKYDILAPKMFEYKKIGETIAENAQYLINRKVEVTVSELTGNVSKAHILLNFQITEVDGKTAKTKFIGHVMSGEYIRRLVKPGKTKIDCSNLYTTKDNELLMLKPMIITQFPITSKQEAGIRNTIKTSLENIISKYTLDNVIGDIISGKLVSDLDDYLHYIVPIKRIEIRASEIVKK